MDAAMTRKMMTVERLVNAPSALLRTLERR